MIKIMAFKTSFNIKKAFLDCLLGFENKSLTKKALMSIMFCTVYHLFSIFLFDELGIYAGVSVIIPVILCSWCFGFYGTILSSILCYFSITFNLNAIGYYGMLVLFQTDATIGWILSLIMGLGFSYFQHLRRKVHSKLMDAEQKIEELRQQENELYSLAKYTLQGLIVIDDNIIVHANERVCDIINIDNKAIIGQHCLEFIKRFTSPDVYIMLQEIHEARKTGKKAPFIYDFKITSAQGVERWVEFNVIKSINPHDKKVFLVVSDISDRKQTEESLRNLANRYRNLVDLLPQTVFEFDVDGTMTFLNKHGCETSGFSLFEVVNKMKVVDFFTDKDKEKYWKKLRNITDKKNVQRMETEILKKDGSTTPTTIFYRPIIENDIPIGIIGTLIDNSERIKRDNDLQKLTQALNQSNNLITIADSEFNIEYINPVCLNILGQSQSNIIGKNLKELSNITRYVENEEAVQEAAENGLNWTGQIQIQTAEGERVWMRTSISPIFNEKNKIVNYLIVSEDITTEIHTQRKLSEADKMAAIGTLAAGVAHEFKNYLGGIIGNASYALEFMDESGDIDLARESLEQVIQIGERANEVAMSLLTYSRVKRSDYSNEDLEVIILRTINLVEKEMKTNSIEVATYFEETPSLHISTSSIQQLLLNLLINARHAIGSNGVITIALINKENTVEIKVGDTGSGISPENLEQVFNPFFSTKGVWGKDDVVGTGMGLSICRNIAREHNGDLHVESTPGVGTTFTLTLPKNPETDITSQPEVPACTNKFKILLFTIDNTILSKYHSSACIDDIQILSSDNYQAFEHNLSEIADLVVCDAGFIGKIELYKLTRLCLSLKIPYILIKCTTNEYLQEDLVEDALKVYSYIPGLTQLVQETSKATKPSSEIIEVIS